MTALETHPRTEDIDYDIGPRRYTGLDAFHPRVIGDGRNRPEIPGALHVELLQAHLLGAIAAEVTTAAPGANYTSFKAQCRSREAYGNSMRTADGRLGLIIDSGSSVNIMGDAFAK